WSARAERRRRRCRRAGARCAFRPMPAAAPAGRAAAAPPRAERPPRARARRRVLAPRLDEKALADGNPGLVDASAERTPCCVYFRMAAPMKAFLVATFVLFAVLTAVLTYPQVTGLRDT